MSIFRNKKHFFTLTMKYQKQKEKNNPLGMATRKIKYLGINLTKEVEDLYSENYTMLKKLKEAQTNGNMYRVHGKPYRLHQKSTRPNK